MKKSLIETAAEVEDMEEDMDSDLDYEEITDEFGRLSFDRLQNCWHSILHLFNPNELDEDEDFDEKGIALINVMFGLAGWTEAEFFEEMHRRDDLIKAGKCPKCGECSGCDESEDDLDLPEITTKANKKSSAN